MEFGADRRRSHKTKGHDIGHRISVVPHLGDEVAGIMLCQSGEACRGHKRIDKKSNRHRGGRSLTLPKRGKKSSSYLQKKSGRLAWEAETMLVRRRRLKKAAGGANPIAAKIQSNRGGGRRELEGAAQYGPTWRL